MKDAKFPDFDTPNNFIDLIDVVKMHAEQDSLWTEEFAKIIDARQGQVQQFVEHMIKSPNHATTAELQFSKVPSACSGHPGNICGPDGTTHISMGPNL